MIKWEQSRQGRFLVHTTEFKSAIAKHRFVISINMDYPSNTNFTVWADGYYDPFIAQWEEMPALIRFLEEGGNPSSYAFYPEGGTGKRVNEKGFYDGIYEDEISRYAFEDGGYVLELCHLPVTKYWATLERSGDTSGFLPMFRSINEGYYILENLTDYSERFHLIFQNAYDFARTRSYF